MEFNHDLQNKEKLLTFQKLNSFFSLLNTFLIYKEI